MIDVWPRYIEFKISFENNRTVSIDEMSNKIKYSFNNCYQIFVYNITAFTYLLKFRIFEFWYSLIVLLWRSSILCLFSSPEPKLQWASLIKIRLLSFVGVVVGVVVTVVNISYFHLLQDHMGNFNETCVELSSGSVDSDLLKSWSPTVSWATIWGLIFT